MSIHFIEYGSCGHVIAQCRCMDKNKDVRRRSSPCAACQTQALQQPEQGKLGLLDIDEPAAHPAQQNEA